MSVSPTNDGARQASVRAQTGTALDYNGDWHALFDQASIAKGPFEGRMLAWVNAQLGASYTEINGALNAFAISQGAPNWSSLGTFSLGPAPNVITETGSTVLTETGSNVTTEH